MSCSDTSNSSENSVISTRDTSPGLSHDLLSKFNFSTSISSKHNTSLAEMERTLFHSGSEQADRVSANMEGDDRTTTLGRGFRSPTSAVSAGGSFHTNWRGHVASSNNFGHAIDSPPVQESILPSPTTPPGFNSFPLSRAQEPVKMLNKLPETVVSDYEMDHIYGYCYDRGDGWYTRLVPVDMLPMLKNVPTSQRDCSGLVILPIPRMPEPCALVNNHQRVQIAVRLPTP